MYSKGIRKFFRMPRFMNRIRILEFGSIQGISVSFTFGTLDSAFPRLRSSALPRIYRDEKRNDNWGLRLATIARGANLGHALLG
jgi:hypothetical protein